MSRWRSFLPPARVFLLLGAFGVAGCGGGSSSSSTGGTSTRATSSTARASTASTAPATSGGAAATGPAPAPRGGSGAAVNARVPATFVIRAGGKLDPSTVSSPASFAVQLTVSSADDQAHQVVLRTPTSHSLNVPARGHASVLIGGLKPGRYALVVDGVVGGALVVGGQPGP